MDFQTFQMMMFVVQQQQNFENFKNIKNWCFFGVTTRDFAKKEISTWRFQKTRFRKLVLDFWGISDLPTYLPTCSGLQFKKINFKTVFILFTTTTTTRFYLFFFNLRLGGWARVGWGGYLPTFSGLQ